MQKPAKQASDHIKNHFMNSKIKFSFLVILNLSFFSLKAQNLVANGDFEQYITCPTDQGQLDYATNWIEVNPSLFASDYLNACSTNSGSDVPVNNLGYQQAHSGVAYSGIFIRQSFGANVKEYLEGQITSTLVANMCYHFEMYINLGDNSKFTSDDIGVYFSDTAVTGISSFAPLPFTPQIINQSGLYADSMNWTLVSGNYTAAGGENFFIIGNFKNDNLLNQMLVNNNGADWIYFYVDDVSLTPCTGIEEQNENNEINVYPNPAMDELIINGYTLAGKEQGEIIITDVTGKKVLQQPIHNYSCTINIKTLKSGFYFIETTGGKNSWRKKFIKQ